MSNGNERQVEGPSTARNPGFFDKTESNYRNMETRARETRERIDLFCDGIVGSQPREAELSKTDQDRHPAAFDRCNAAESNMYGAMNQLEEAITRLEQLGLT